MKASSLVILLNKAIEAHGDLEVLIDSSDGEYPEALVSYAGPTKLFKNGDKWPAFTGELVFYLTSDATESARFLKS